MKIYGAPPSPYARKVRIVAAELGLLDRIEFIDTEGGPLDPPGAGARRLNPLSKIPFLVYPSGRVVYDSLVVCLALIDEVPDQTLLPAAGPDRIEVLTREALSRGASDAAISAIYEVRYRPEAQQMADWIEGQWRKVSAALDAMEAIVPPPGRFDLGDCAWASTLSHIELRFSDRHWRDGRRGLSDWFDAVSSRPSVSAIL